jgi:RimJ/RimL family protein N-acetyltransferase
MRLETARLALISIQFTDSNDLFQAVKESLADLNRFHAWATATYTLRDTQNHVQESIAGSREGRGETLIVRSRAGRLFGEVALTPVADPFGQPPHAYKLTFWIRSSELPQDFAPEALQGVATHVFATLKGKRLSAEVSSLDAGAAKALEKAGFQKEAVLKQTRRLPDDTFADTVIYTRLS